MQRPPSGGPAPCWRKIEDLPDEIDWFPERAWGGRIWIPASAHSDSEEGRIELYGYVSYVQPPGGEPTDFSAKAALTDVLAEDNADWKIDLNDDVIGRWRSAQTGATTSISALTPGAFARRASRVSRGVSSASARAT